MRFRIQDSNAILLFDLMYRPEEYSFDVEPKPQSGGSSLLVNDLQLEVDDDGRIIYVWGLCPYHAWSEKSLNVPCARSGALMVDIPDDLVPGISIRITRERWPVAVDRRSGWVRLGSDEAGDEAIEFAPGSIALLSDGRLVSLWLHPCSLPDP